jgi:hypothetical protein
MKRYEDSTKPGKQIVWAEKVGKKKLSDDVMRKHNPQPDYYKIDFPNGDILFLPPEVFELRFLELAD